MKQTDEEGSNTLPLIEHSVRDVVRQVADPARDSGGGVVVGLTLAGAAASAELVLRLAVKRKSLANRRDEIAALLDAVESARRSFEDAADQDVAAFKQLVETQREVKQLPETDSAQTKQRLVTAYVRASDVPMSLAQQALEFMRNAERGLEFASRFTVSDIGAAAALARGAIEAALLTVEANLAYVERDLVAIRRDEMAALRAEATAIADRVLTVASRTITGQIDRS
ncbi:MAG TPA: cyclodeaminase/cyclohydrolase family protein [Nitrolancea sp.]|nr:cyclodeaminase/cyclohydrolase family protein [Nitrolancea sp.]